MKTPKKGVKILVIEQIHALLCVMPSEMWTMYVLVGLGTGLRRDDLFDLEAGDVYIQSQWIDTTSRKTAKVKYRRPLPSALIPRLQKYIEGMQPDYKLFSKRNHFALWPKFRDNANALLERAKLSNLKRDFVIKNLRQTHITLCQAIGSIGTAQRQAEHSSSQITAHYYTDEEYIDKWKVDQLPVNLWLDYEKFKTAVETKRPPAEEPGSPEGRK